VPDSCGCVVPESPGPVVDGELLQLRASAAKAVTTCLHIRDDESVDVEVIGASSPKWRIQAIVATSATVEYP
jgi:hypothetical protein